MFSISPTGKPDRPIEERLRDDKLPEGGKAADPAIAGTDIGGGARVGDQFIAGEADAAGMHDVGMEIDQAREHELAGGIKRLHAARWRDLGLKRGDHGIANADIAATAQTLAGIQHLATADHEVVGVVRPEGRGSRCCLLNEAGRGDRRAGAVQERPASHVIHGLAPRLRCRPGHHGNRGCYIPVSWRANASDASGAAPK
jgi:hypothetical protein